MYIALKWLVGMVVAMWLVLCTLDMCWKKSLTKELDYDSLKLFTPLYNNTSRKLDKNSYKTERMKILNDSHNNIYLQYLMFLAGVCLVSAFNRKNDIIMFTKRKCINLNFYAINDFLQTTYLKQPAKLIGAAMVKYFKISFTLFFKTNHRDINFILFNKLKELRQERKNLNEMLFNAIQENKKMRMQYRLETDVKNKIAQNKYPQKQLIENRLPNIIFQQLYFVTHQENILLKSRIKELTKEKDDAERKLIKLINQVCQSKNNDLKAYCSQFIVHTENNLLNSDVKAEIDKFLQKSSDAIYFQERNHSPEQNNQHSNFDTLSINPTEFIENENLNTAVQNQSKVKHFPGEYVWTVKDKNGIIEKIYEYGGDFDNGDMIRRIRRYSVYYDTECLLDFSNSTTFINNQNAEISNIRNKFTNIKLTLTNRRFLSSSQAFRNFLQNNNSLGKQNSLSLNSTV